MKISLKRNNVLVTLGLVLSLTSCLDVKESFYDKQASIDDQKITSYLSDHHIVAAKHFTGFYYESLTPSDPAANYAPFAKDDVIDFRYKISLLDGTLVEDSMASKRPAQLKLLNYSILPQALDRGISLMFPGAKYRFYIPSNLAYGDYRSSKFPSLANLIVEVQVTGKHSETDLQAAQLDSIDQYVKSKYTSFDKFASGLYYVSTLTGTGDKPRLGDRVRINMTRKYLDGTVIKSVQGLVLNLDHTQAVQGLEEGILQMRTGGKAVLVMPASIAFQQSLCLIPQKVRSELLEDQLISSEVLPYSIVQYEVELTGIYGNYVLMD